MTAYSPDDVPGWRYGPLRPVERAWLSGRRLAAAQAAADEAPGRRMPYRMQRAVDRWSDEAGWVAVGLQAATATVPPTSRADRLRRRSGHADPTAATTHATIDTVEREAAAWGHLAGPCRADGTVDDQGRRHDCPFHNATNLGWLLGIDLDAAEMVDCLTGTPSTSAAFVDAVSQAAAWHSTAASRVHDAWRDAYRAGAEPIELEVWVELAADVGRQMAGLAGRLAGWSGRQEATCKSCGGARPAGRATCGACRTANWRAKMAPTRREA